MSEEENKALVRRFFDEIFCKGDPTVANEILGTDFVFYGPNAGVHGSKDFLQFTNMPRTALNIRFTIEVVIADGDKVATFSIMSGTHLKEFWGIPPSGNQIRIPRIDNFQIIEGKIREVRTTLDHQGLIQQLNG